MNILYLVNYAGKGGTEQYVYTLTQHKRPEDTVFFLYNKAGPLCQRMEALGVTPEQLPMKRPFDILAAKKLAAYCGKNNIHLIHTQFQRENTVATLAKMFYPEVKLLYTSHLNLTNNGVWKAFNRFTGKKLSALIAVCKEGRRLLIANGFPPEKVQLVFNGIPPVEKENNGVDENTTNFLTITRFSGEKGIFFLLEAVRALKDMTAIPFTVTMAGDGPLFEQAKAFVKTQGIEAHVHFTGFLADTEHLFQNTLAYINSSESEALSFAILEAMAHGLPIIASRVGGNVDLVNQDTGCGLLVDYGDSEALAKAMLSLLTDGQAVKTYGHKAKIAAQTTFSQQTMLDATFALYNAITNEE